MAEIVHAQPTLHEVRRYLVFSAEVERGGWLDYISAHHTQAEAERAALYMVEGAGSHLWSQVADCLERRLVTKYRRFVGRED